MFKDYSNMDVLNFYKKLPFNYYGNIDIAKNNIIKTNSVEYYAILPKILKNINLIDIGCGTGFFVNSVNYYYGKYKTKAYGIDFNSVSLEQAKKISLALNLNSEFELANLFEYNPNQFYDLAVSIGVLHHTNNCIEAMRHIIRNFIKPNGYIFIGLYHSYGRKPFLDYFNKLKKEGLSEDALFKKFLELRKGDADYTHNLSWFYDQVLHPHETTHSLSEILPFLHSENIKLISSSINKFKIFKTEEELIKLEKSYYDIGLAKLRDKIYFPGFFVFLGQKKQKI